MIGKVKEKYHVSGKEAADFIKKVIKSNGGKIMLIGTSSSAHQVEGNDKNTDWWHFEMNGRLPYKSGSSPFLYVITGTLQRLASITGIPNPSQREGKTNTSNELYILVVMLTIKM